MSDDFPGFHKRITQHQVLDKSDRKWQIEYEVVIINGVIGLTSKFENGDMA
jgi:hypothetical protein